MDAGRPIRRTTPCRMNWFLKLTRPRTLTAKAQQGAGNSHHPHLPVRAHHSDPDEGGLGPLILACQQGLVNRTQLFLSITCLQWILHDFAYLIVLVRCPHFSRHCKPSGFLPPPRRLFA